MKKKFALMILTITALLVIAQASAQAQTQNQQNQNASGGGQKTTDDQQEVLKKIQELQKQVDTLKEQGRTREKLTQTAEEKAAQDKALLTAVGREYTLMPKGKIEVEYSLRYEYISSSTLVSSTSVEARSNHTIRNTISVQYGLLNNLNVNIGVPYVYVYDKSGSSSAKDASDMGDITVGVDFQPFKPTGMWPATTFSLGAVLPTGRSPYKIDRDTDLPTGSGLYAFSLGMNMSKSIDPAMAFCAVSAVYRLMQTDLNQYWSSSAVTLERVEPGMSFSAAVGLAYSISYALSMNTQFQYAYNMSSTYSFTSGSQATTPAYSTASLVIGAGWRFSPKTTLSFSVGVGLTKDDPDFFFLFRLPFDF